jgi:hypothetical protein
LISNGNTKSTRTKEVSIHTIKSRNVYPLPQWKELKMIEEREGSGTKRETTNFIRTKGGSESEVKDDNEDKRRK